MGNLVSTNQPRAQHQHQPRGLSPLHNSHTQPKEVVGVEQVHVQSTDTYTDSAGYPPSTYSSCRDTASINTHPEDTFPWPTIADGHFINTETLRAEPSSNQSGPRVRARNVFPQDESNRSLTSDQLLKKWKAAVIPQQRTDVIRHVLTIRIPYLESEKQYLESAVFLKIHDEFIIKRVKESLMKCLLRGDDELDVSQILEAEVHVWRRLRHHEDHVFDLGIINLLLWCCLLCNTDVSKELEERICDLSRERRTSIQEYRHEIQSTASSDLFKAMQSFHEDFPRRFAKPSVLPWGNDVRTTSKNMDEETLNLVKKAKFCDKLLHLFSVLKQILASGNDCESILCYLRFILPSLLDGHPDGKETQTIAVLLTKGCVFALQTAFFQADVQVGPKELPTKRNLARLLEFVLDEQDKKKTSIASILNFAKTGKHKKCSYNRRQYILDELSPLICHPAESVRNPVHKLFSRFRQDFMGTLTRREIERGQSNCRLHIDTPTRADSNYFQKLKGKMGHQSVIIYANVPSFEDMNTNSGNSTAPSDESQWDKERHINNFNMQRSIPSHINLGWLLGYQVKPFLMYYIVEDCHQTTLLEYVLEKRERNNWIEEKELCTILTDIVMGLSALHQNNIILRNMSLSNFFLDRGQAKVGDLSLACQYRAKNNMPIKDPYAWNLPVRWLSPEALKEGSFSPQSDIWSLGHLIYTLWTHGCEPYTEFPDSSTDDIMEKVAFSDLTPFQWPCMPQTIYNLMCRCLEKDPRDRIELEELMSELKTYTDQLPDQDVYNDTQKVTFQEIKARDRHYGAPSVHQKKRCNVPEKGIPQFILDYRKALRERSEYSCPPKRKSGSQKHYIKDPLDLKLNYVDRGVMVMEPMRDEFVTKVLPQIEATGFKPLKRFNPVLHKDGAGNYIEGTAYPESRTLKDIALEGTLGRDDPGPYIHLCYQVIKHFSDIHAKGWVCRDSRPKNFLVNLRTLEVYMCRKGRMVQLPVTETGSEFIKEDKDSLRETHRWLPAESVIDGIFSKASDVSAWAYMTYDVMEALSGGDPKKCVPYYTVSDQELGMVKQNGEYLPKPKVCPGWLYGILLKCWNPDRNQRCPIASVINELENRLELEIQQHRGRMEASLDGESCPKYEYLEASRQDKPLNWFKRRRTHASTKTKASHNNQVSVNSLRNSGNYANISHEYHNPAFRLEENPYSTVGYQPVEFTGNRKSRRNRMQSHVRNSAGSSISRQSNRGDSIRRSRQQRLSALQRKRRSKDIPLPKTPSEEYMNTAISLDKFWCENRWGDKRDDGFEVEKQTCTERSSQRKGGMAIGEVEQEQHLLLVHVERSDMAGNLETDRAAVEEGEGDKSQGQAQTTGTEPEQILYGNRENCHSPQEQILYGNSENCHSPQEQILYGNSENCHSPQEQNISLSLAKGQKTRIAEQGNNENMVLNPGPSKEENTLLENLRNDPQEEKRSHLDNGVQSVMVAAYQESSRTIRTQEVMSRAETRYETDNQGSGLNADSNPGKTELQNTSQDKRGESGRDLENQGQRENMTKGPQDQRDTNIQYRESQRMTDNEDMKTAPIMGTNLGQTARLDNKRLDNQRKDRHSEGGCVLESKTEDRVQIRVPESQVQMKNKGEKKQNEDADVDPRQISGIESRVFNQGLGRNLDRGGRDLNNKEENRKAEPDVGHPGNGQDVDIKPEQRVLENQNQGFQAEDKSDQKNRGYDNLSAELRIQRKSRKQSALTEHLSEVRNEETDIGEQINRESRRKHTGLTLQSRRKGTGLTLESQRQTRHSQVNDTQSVLPGQTKEDRRLESCRDVKKQDRRPTIKRNTKDMDKRRKEQRQDENTTANKWLHVEQQGGALHESQRKTSKREPDLKQTNIGDMDKGSHPPQRWDFDGGSNREDGLGLTRFENQEHKECFQGGGRRGVGGGGGGEGGGGGRGGGIVSNGDQSTSEVYCNTEMRKVAGYKEQTLNECKDRNSAIRKSIANERDKKASLNGVSVKRCDQERAANDHMFNTNSRFQGFVPACTRTLHELDLNADAMASTAIESIVLTDNQTTIDDEDVKY